MTVQELINRLSTYDPNATVLLMEQPQWPFEYSIRSIKSRKEIYENGRCQCQDEADECYCFDLDEDTSMSDVFIVEGRQLRYGDRNAWQ